MNARKFHWEVQDIWVGAKTPKIFRAEMWSKASQSPLQGLTCVDLLKSNGTRSKSEQRAFNWANYGLETVSLWQRTHNALFKQNSNYRRAEPLARLEAIFDATTLPRKWSRHNGPLSQSFEIFSFAISTALVDVFCLNGATQVCGGVIQAIVDDDLQITKHLGTQFSRWVIYCDYCRAVNWFAARAFDWRCLQ